MLDQATVTALAAKLDDAERTHVQLPHFSGQHAGMEIADSYAIQRAWMALKREQGRSGLQNIEAIASTEGVDGVFIGPSDLAAALGHLGDPAHGEVQQLSSRPSGGCARPQGGRHSDGRRGVRPPLS